MNEAPDPYFEFKLQAGSKNPPPESSAEGKRQCKLIDALDNRARYAFTIRRRLCKNAKFEERPGPNYATLDDDQILALWYQEYRADCMRLYGYIPSHFDWLNMEWVERNPPFKEPRKSLGGESLFAAFKEKLGT